MEYISTRGDSALKKFCDILLEGLAPDGGLYMPVRYPQVADRLSAWRTLTYPELAFEICSLYIDDIPAKDLKAIIDKTYTREAFGTNDIVPVSKLQEGIYLAHLSNGPTYAFKDMALQLLGNLFEYELQRRGEVLNILGATSGDTGSAAEYALRGKKGVNVFMLSPHERMSSFQQAQMYSLQDENIHNLAVRGVFDDCQDIVKAVSNDLAFKKQYHIGTVNSINWARLLAQVVYYFYSYFRATDVDDNEELSFAVPSGNFGNICAAHVARMMGLPIYRLMLATNENNVLEEFFNTGVYRVRSSEQTFETSSPSMDISKASNFERFMFDLAGRDAQQVQQWFGVDVPKQGEFSIPEEMRLLAHDQYGFVAGCSTHKDRLRTMQMIYEDEGVLIDPHTADAVKVAHDQFDPWVSTVVMETALPCKFALTVKEALGIEPPVPEKVAGLVDLPRRFEVVDADVGVVRDYMVNHLRAS